MARIRTIKPEFFTSEDIVGLSPLARLLYIALWCEADREGRMVWKPRTFKLRYLPADDCDADELCAELIGAGLVIPYGDGYAYIPAFARHQHLNPRESTSVLPDPHEPPPKSTRSSRVGTRRDASARVPHAQGGREGKGKEGEIQTPPTPPLPQGGAFEQFWQAWPKHKRKVAEDQCRRKWQSKGCDAVSEAVMSALEAAKASDDWRKDNREFIPAPLVWLNQARWEAPTEAQAAADEQDQHWHDSRAGIEGKGEQLGIGRWDEAAFGVGRGEAWPAYRRRVFTAAGHEPLRATA